jgi:hypothetical protein
MVVRTRDHPLVRLDIFVEDELAGLGALDPKVFFHLSALQEAADLWNGVGNPVQR